MTNYEHIKSLSPKEMVEFILDDCVTEAQIEFCQNCQKEHNGDCMTGEYCLYNDSFILLWWLNQPAEKEETK